MRVGFAFFNREVVGWVPRHLNVVVAAKGDNFLLVSITTGGLGWGKTLTHRDWRKILRPSQAGNVVKITRYQLELLEARRLWQLTEDAPVGVVQTIRMGLRVHVKYSNILRDFE